MTVADTHVLDDAVTREFAAALPHPDAVITDNSAMTKHGHDFWGLGGVPGLVLQPRTRDEVVAIVNIAAKHGLPLVTRGGASNCAGAVMPDPNRVMIDLSAMNQIVAVDPETRTARIQPGIVNNTLQEALAPHGLCFSPDPVSSHLATVGGNIIENAGGPHALKYGVTYHHVVEAEAVLADGTVVNLRSDTDGADLLGILIGSEGTLAILTEATVSLRPIPPVTRSLMGSFSSAHDAADTVAAIIETGTVPACVEWLDHTGIVGLQQFTDTGYPQDAAAIVLVDVDGTHDEVERDAAIVDEVMRRKATEVRRADTEEDRHKLWFGRLHAPDLVVESGKGFFIGDVTVPRQHFPEMQDAIQAAAARHTDGLLFIMTCGHAGDGDLHPFTFYDRDNPKAPAALKAANNEIIDAALSLGGTITGEHGVGTEKRPFMTKRFTPVEIAAQRAIKRVFDPTSSLNPGIMLPDVSDAEPDVSTFEAAVRHTLQPYLTGGATTAPQPVTSSASADQHIVVNKPNLSLVVGAGVTIGELARHLADSGVTCGAIPATGTERTIGELISNATGADRDAVRHALLGLDVVLPDGNASARFGGESMKDVAGYDTKRLFIGSGHAFGTITSAVFKISVARGTPTS